MASVGKIFYFIAYQLTKYRYNVVLQSFHVPFLISNIQKYMKRLKDSTDSFPACNTSYAVYLLSIFSRPVFSNTFDVHTP